MSAANQRFAVDYAWEAILTNLGVAKGELLRHAGLPADLFARPKPELTIDEYFRLWRSLEVLLNDPAFALRVGTAVPAEAFSPPIFAAFCSPNLDIALQRLSRYKPLIGPLRLDLSATGQGIAARYGAIAGQGLPSALATTELVFLVNLARMATRQRIVPERIELAGMPAQARPLEEFFGVRLRSGAENIIVFSQADCARPFVTVNEAMFRTFEPVLGARLEELQTGTDFRDRLRACLMEALPSGRAAMAEVADRLAVSPRTLQRRLAEAGSSFQEELGRLRAELAQHYLANSDYSSAEISFLLGYEDPNSFIRAFHGWTGRTPQAMRAESRLH